MSERLSDYVRVTKQANGIRLATRAGTSSSDHFGDAQTVNLTEDEAEALKEYLNDNLGDE